MKKSYKIIFSLIILTFLLIAVYLIEIPSPTKIITEDYKLEIK